MRNADVEETMQSKYSEIQKSKDFRASRISVGRSELNFAKDIFQRLPKSDEAKGKYVEASNRFRQILADSLADYKTERKNIDDKYGQQKDRLINEVLYKNIPPRAKGDQ